MYCVTLLPWASLGIRPGRIMSLGLLFERSSIAFKQIGITSVTLDFRKGSNGYEGEQMLSFLSKVS